MEGFRGRGDAGSDRYRRFRHRPHSNPLSDLSIRLPCETPEDFPLDRLYPGDGIPHRRIDLLDIGCGYGDFVVGMAEAHPELRALGVEIRDAAAAIAQQQILDRRADGRGTDERASGEQNPAEAKSCKACPLANAAVLRCNAMTQLPHLLARNSLSLVTVMFPDPHFKNSAERRRVVSPTLLTEYAYYLRPGGLFMFCTDVSDLHEHVCAVTDAHPLFRRVLFPQDEEVQRVASPAMPFAAVEAQLQAWAQTAWRLMERTADAERHRRKDEDKRVWKSMWARLDPEEDSNPERQPVQHEPLREPLRKRPESVDSGSEGAR